MKTKIEIIEETIIYYSEDPGRKRAVDEDNVCVYFTNTEDFAKSETMCAVGRCMNPKKAQETGISMGRNVFHLDIDLREAHHCTLDSILKEEYRGHEIKFWRELQSLHDFFGNWNANGLSEKGLTNVNALKARWRGK